jgi:hypothetical protein
MQYVVDEKQKPATLFPLSSVIFPDHELGCNSTDPNFNSQSYETHSWQLEMLVFDFDYKCMKLSFLGDSDKNLELKLVTSHLICWMHA